MPRYNALLKRLVSSLFALYVALVLSAAIAADIPRSWNTDEASGSGLRKPAETNDSLPGSNNIVDIIFVAPDVWAATAKGPSRLTMPGDQWTTYDETDGLPSIEIPALAVFPNGVWTATSHTEVREGGLVTWGDGLYRFNDANGTWEERTPAGDQASGPFQVSYDLAHYRGRTLSACFAGGLVASSDDGVTWENIFADNTARSDFNNKVYNDLNNRYFAVVVDSTRLDSLAVWAGTAYGINKFVYLNDTLKPKGYRFNDIHMDGVRLYGATEDGLSRTPDRGGSWRTFNSANDGFPTNRVISTAAKGDTLWAGFVAEDGETGAGLAYSFNSGATWTVTTPPQATNPGRRPVAISLSKGRVWVACVDGGVIYSDMPTIEWESAIGIESYSLLPVPADTPHTVFMGTNIGIYAWPIAGAPLPGTTFPVGDDADSVGQRVIAMGYQITPCREDSSAIWALCENNGAPTGYPGFGISYDEGETWNVSSRRLGVHDVVFEGCRFWLASDSGLAEGDVRNLDSLMFTASYKTLVTNKRVGAQPLALGAEINKDQLSGADVLTALWVGTDSLLARSLDKGITWAVVFSNPDSADFDLLEFFRYRDDDTAVAGFEQLSGNFITALGFQPGGRGAIWAATQATGQGRFANTFIGAGEKDGLSVTRDAGKTWSVPLTGHQVWNFAFDGAIVWAASSQGLLRSPDNGVSWDTLNFFEDPESGAIMDSSVEYFAVEIVDDEVWAGTENGMVILDRNGNLISVRRKFKEVVSSDPGSEAGAYASPVPFSPRRKGASSASSTEYVRFHFVPPTSGSVRIRIYDFANNIVKTLESDRVFTAGEQSNEDFIWDGHNGGGDDVAVGTYFFVIEYSGGETHWGKLVVIP